MSVAKHSTRAQTNTRTISVRLPKVIVNWMDRLVKSGVYSARAEIIREFSREYIQRQQILQRQGLTNSERYNSDHKDALQSDT